VVGFSISVSFGFSPIGYSRSFEKHPPTTESTANETEISAIRRTLDAWPSNLNFDM